MSAMLFLGGGRGGKKKDTPETRWRRACIEWLKLRFQGRIWHVRTVGGIGQRPGLPDDLFVIRNGKSGPGIFVAIEFKAPESRHKLSELQAAEIEAIRQAGGRAGAVRSWEDLERLVEGIEPVQLGLGMDKKRS